MIADWHARVALLPSLAALTVLVGAACLPASLSTPTATPAATAPPAALPSLNVVYTSITGNRVPLWIGAESHIFEQYGTQVQPNYIASTPTAIVTLISGDTDVLEASGGDLVSAYSKGADLKVIGTVETTTGYQLLVKPDIQTPQQLADTKIGVSKLGSSSYLFVLQMLKAMHMDQQVAIVATGELPSTRAAFASNAIQGYVDAPENTTGMDPSTFHTLGDPAALGVAGLGHLLTVRTDYLQSHRPALVNFLKGYVAALAYSYAHPDAVKQSFAAHLQQGDSAFVDASYNSYFGTAVGNGALPPDPVPTTALMQRQIDLDAAADTSVDPSQLSAAALADPSLMNEIESSPFWNQTWPNGLPAS